MSITSWKCAKNQVIVRRCRIGTASGERSPTREKQPSLGFVLVEIDRLPVEEGVGVFRVQAD